MKPFSMESVYLRFLAYLIPLVVVASVLTFTVFGYVEYRGAMDELHAEISTEVATSSLLIAESVYGGEVYNVRLALAGILSNPHIAGITVVNSSDEILDYYGLQPGGDGCLLKQMGINFTEGDSILRVGQLSVCYQDTKIIADFYQRLLYLVALMVLLVFLAIGSAFIAYRSTVGIPLTRLYQRIVARVEDGKHVPVEWHSDDEIGRVITEYNRMQFHITEQEDLLQANKSSLEARLQQGQKMEAVGRLAGGIAHDFNNMLTAIIGFTQIAQHRLAKIEETNVNRELDHVLETSHRAARLTDQLLTFSRKQIVDPVVLDLNQVIEATLEMLKRVIRENIDIQMNLDPEIASIEIDRSQLEQILLNLAINASDAMPDGGELSISTKPLDVLAGEIRPNVELPVGAFVLLNIADTGGGIDPELMPNIFDPFYTTKESAGVGLGLSTVYGIVKQNSGYISVDSEIGGGASFSIFLPAKTGQVVEKVQLHKDAAEPTHEGTVALAEDDEFVRALASIVLSNAGYFVLEAASGEEVLRKIRETDTTVDLLLTDVIMPGMNGRELAKLLAREKPGIQVLFMSGYSDDLLVDDYSRLDVERFFLRKPFSPDELVGKVSNILNI